MGMMIVIKICSLFCSCQTVKTKEEKEVLEHFAGVVSNQRSTVNYIARVHNNVILHNFTCYIKACLFHCNEIHMHLCFHLLPLSLSLSLSPSLSFPLLPSFFLPPFVLSLLPPIPPLPPVHNDEHEYVQGDLCGGGGVSC